MHGFHALIGERSGAFADANHCPENGDDGAKEVGSGCFHDSDFKESAPYTAAMISVRPLAPDDSLTAITVLLHAAYARLAAMGLNYTAADQSTETTAQRFAQGHGLLAFDGDALVGTIVVTPPLPKSPCDVFRQQHVASVHQFGVYPDAQGAGVGRALLDASASWARARIHSTRVRYGRDGAPSHRALPTLGLCDGGPRAVVGQGLPQRCDGEIALKDH